MKSIIVSSLLLLIPTLARSKTPYLSPGNFSAASLTVAFDRTIKLTEKNKFRFPVTIDSYNRCYITSQTPLLKKKLTISKGSQWRSQPSEDWSDWDSKKFSFKLTHKNISVLLKCELNLAGEILLHHSNLTKKSSSACARQGGYIRTHSPKSITQQKTGKNIRLPSSAVASQGYCIKRVSKLNTSKFRLAFLKQKIHLNMEFPTSETDVDAMVETDTF